MSRKEADVIPIASPLIRGDDQVPLAYLMPDEEYMYEQFPNAHLYAEPGEDEAAAEPEPWENAPGGCPNCGGTGKACCARAAAAGGAHA